MNSLLDGEQTSCFAKRQNTCTGGRSRCILSQPPDTSHLKVSLTGVAINHDGRAATITAPNGTAQQRVLRSALAERQTAGEDVTMIECHGTGACTACWVLSSLLMVNRQKSVHGKVMTD